MKLKLNHKYIWGTAQILVLKMENKNFMGTFPKIWKIFTLNMKFLVEIVFTAGHVFIFFSFYNCNFSHKLANFQEYTRAYHLQYFS